MELTGIDMLIHTGQLRAYLSDRLSHEVLVAYNRTFGDVQELSVELDILGAICNRLMLADSDSRMKFWDYLNTRQHTSAKMSTRTSTGTRTALRSGCGELSQGYLRD